jgi:hypothetical protein
MKLSEVAAKAITLARKVRKYYDAVLPKWYPDYPIYDPAQEKPPAPKEEQELRNLLQSLPAEMIYRLILIAYLGREDFGVEDLSGRYEDLKQKFGIPERAVIEMMGTVVLGEYLSDGLAELKRRRIPVDDRTCPTNHVSMRRSANTNGPLT